MGPPEGEIGVPTDLQVVLVRSAELIIVADRFVCYPTGFEFTLTVKTKNPAAGPVMMMGGPHASRRRAPASATGHLPDDLLRFGLAYADGRKATNLSRPPFASPRSSMAVGTATSKADGPPEPSPPVLIGQGGSGGDGRWSQNIWVWGLPPSGTVGLVVEWPSEGVPETRVDVDASAIRAAAERADVVWERQE